MTYGLLSKVPSPKEARDRTKQAVEKKKNVGISKDGGTAEDGEKVKGEEPMVVRTVCHVVEMTAGKEISQSKKEIHSGRVWVSVMFQPRSMHQSGITLCLPA